MKILLVGAVIAVIVGLWRYLRNARRRKKQTSPFAIPLGVTIGSTRLLIKRRSRCIASCKWPSKSAISCLVRCRYGLS